MNLMDTFELTPFNAALEAALACFPLLPLVAAPVKTYASAIALKELAIAAAAGAHPSSSLSHLDVEFGI